MQKPFSLYHEIEFKYHKKTSVFLAMNVREQFQFVPSKWFPLDTLIQMKKLQRVPLVHVIRESVHRASASKKSTPKRSWVLCEITDKGTHPTWRTGAWWWRSGGSDAIWFTGGPPPKNIACYFRTLCSHFIITLGLHRLQDGNNSVLVTEHACRMI